MHAAGKGGGAGKNRDFKYFNSTGHMAVGGKGSSEHKRFG